MTKKKTDNVQLQDRFLELGAGTLFIGDYHGIELWGYNE